MKAIIITVLFFSSLVTTSSTALGMSHQGHPDSAEKQSTHETPAKGKMFIIGDMTSKGVRGMAHLNDVSETMKAMGSNVTHHFMIAFADVQTGEQIEVGAVALKVQDPDAKITGPIKLIGMQGHFGADITLSRPGEYHFKLGTELADGVKRKYHFHHTIK